MGTNCTPSEPIQGQQEVPEVHKPNLLDVVQKTSRRWGLRTKAQEAPSRLQSRTRQSSRWSTQAQGNKNQKGPHPKSQNQKILRQNKSPNLSPHRPYSPPEPASQELHPDRQAMLDAPEKVPVLPSQEQSYSQSQRPQQHQQKRGKKPAYFEKE